MSNLNNTPKTIPEYLELLRNALKGKDPALVQDALYDAEEYLRAELAQYPDDDEASVVAKVAGSYGAPEEVAEIYNEREVAVSEAFRSPRASIQPTKSSAGVASVGVSVNKKPQNPIAWFFGVAADPRAYAALFYMLLSMFTGIFYFTWAVTGLSLSAGFMILIIGIPFAVLFMGTVWALSLVEGRLVETMLGVRMPRRPAYGKREGGFLTRIKEILVDPRTWATLLYMLMMLPLGIVYFTIAITALATSLSCLLAPIAFLMGYADDVQFYYNGVTLLEAPWMMVPMFIGGALGVFVTLHVARGIGKLHGMMAKHLLVKIA
ncbi:MAG TPA: sensor domain-containing protein [Arenimonas sp.]|nr:sensor domain-containing protein [Arenimonas sp.]